MAKKNTTNTNNSYHRPNFWGMIRDVAIASLNKGQFPFGIIGAIFIILVVKLSPEDSSKLLFDLLNLIKNNELIGWIFAFLTSIGWYGTSRYLRRVHTKEIKRISDEKKGLQQTLVGNKKLLSSND